jgi:hypothetical protein
MDVVLKNGEKYRYHIPPGSYLTPQDLENGLHMGMKAKLEKQYSTGITAPSETVKPKRSTSMSASESPKTKSFKGPPENVQTDFRI